MTKRPSFTDLPLATKATAAPPAEAPAPEKLIETMKPKDDRVTIVLRVSAEDRRALKMISAREDRTIQDMLHDAVQDIIRRST